MEFYYKNSQGRVIDFTQAPFIGMLSNDLFSYSWDYITQGQAVQKIVKFEKLMKEKQFNVVISGEDESDYLGNLDKFLQYIDVDIDNLKMGELHVGKYFLECYIIANSKGFRYLNTTKTKVQLSIVCEKGNWQSSELFSYISDDDQSEDTGTGIDYPYDYLYDFSAGFDKNTIVNESYMATDFELTFYGPIVLPEVTIGGNVYRVNHEVEVGEYLKINSKKKTVTLYKIDGTTENLFAYRDRDNYIFEKIHAGGNIVLWNSEELWDIRLFYERSEPKWSDVKWT